MKRIAKARNKHTMNWAFVPQNISSPSRLSQYSHKGRRLRHNGQATRLANDLFSYYSHKGKSSSFTLAKSQHQKIHPQSHKFSMSSDPIKVRSRQYRRKDSDVKIKVIPDQDLSSHPNDYTSEFTNMSTDHHKIELKKSLPTLPEGAENKKNNRSAPRLSKLGFPIAGRMKYRKRRLNINKIASNLHKKDIIPRFNEGVIQQMSKQRQHKPMVKSWYQNLEGDQPEYRKARTASGKRNINMARYTTNHSQEEIKEVHEEDQIFETEQQPEVSEEEKVEAMRKMINDALRDHLTTQTHLITYPNNYIEWSMHSLYSDIVNNEVKEFNHEK